MSTRQMARMYTGEGAEDIGPGLGSLLSNIFGQDKITGGFTVGPDNKLVPGEYKGSGGLFGRRSRMNADALNRAIMLQRYLTQMEQEGQLKIEKERTKGELEKLTKGQVVSLMQLVGIPYTEENFKVFNERLTGTRLNTADIESKTNLERTKQKSDYVKSPKGQENFLTGLAGEDILPAARAQNLATTPLGPNSGANIGLPLFNKRGLNLWGPTVEEGVEEVGGTPLKMPNGQTINLGSRPTSVRKVSYPLNPDIVKEAAGISPTPEISPTPAQYQPEPVMPITTTNKPVPLPVPTSVGKPFTQRSGLVPKAAKAYLGLGNYLGQNAAQTGRDVERIGKPLLQQIIQALIGQ